MITQAHLEPWMGNIVELTVTDGTAAPVQMRGMLERIDDSWVRLRPARGQASLPDGGRVLIAHTTSVKRGGRN